MAALGSAAQLRSHDFVWTSCKFVFTATLKNLFKKSFQLYKTHEGVFSELQLLSLCLALIESK